jgi:predicted NodU family carbamoyl transferase
MIILGLCDSVESHACILKDGNLVAAISEERLSRIKADAGYPKRSIDKVLEIARLQPSDIDLVAVAGYDNGLFQSIYKPGALFSIQDWIEQNEKYWKPKLYDKKKLDEIDDFLIWKKKYPAIKKNIYKELIIKAKKNNVKDHIRIFNEVRK